MMLRRFILTVTALWLAVSQVEAASRAETSAFSWAANAFRAGVWELAEKDLGGFVENYPKSTNATLAVLMQAEARMKLGRFNEAADLLTTRLNQAGDRTDEYLYWLGQIKFQDAKFPEAAAVFGRLASEFPKSARRLEAALGEAASLAKSKPEQWSRVIELLGDANGVFQSAASRDPTSELVYRGGLLLAEAQFALKNFPAAESALVTLTNQQSDAELQWRRQYLLCGVQLADDRAEEAWTNATELPALAGGVLSRRADSVALQANILERLQRTGDAINAYQKNLGNGVPPEHQRQALFKIAQLSMALGKWDDATNKLEMFLEQNTNSPVKDMVLFTLGDLLLQQYQQYLAGLETNRPPGETTPSANPTNLLAAAAVRFQSVLDNFPKTALTGQALLNEGWCLWFMGDMAGSLDAFQAATQQLPFSGEQLVARFKWADAQSRMHDFAGAVTNYGWVVNRAQESSEPATRELVEPALYQWLRASLEANDFKSVDDALAKILDGYLNSFIADRSLLLAGQGFAMRSDTARARTLFAEAEKQNPNSTLLPEIRLAIARTFEQEQNWTNAIQQYDDWLAIYTNNPAQPRAEYYRAWAHSQAGNETNALNLFTNLLARFPTNEYAPQARWWVADHYFQAGDFVNAEKNYQRLYLDWPATDLAYQAWMMAGRTAVARQNYSDSIYYFTNLTSNPNCPPDLKAEATFAYGDSLMSLVATGSNRVENLDLAVKVFRTINATNQLFAPALGEIGNCYLQWAALDPAQYSNATNAYQQAMDSPQADVATRSQAEVGLAMVYEKMAETTNEPEKAKLLYRALEHYWHVVLKAETSLKSSEEFNVYWASRAGLAAGRLEEAFQQTLQATNLYQLRVMNLSPLMHADMERRIKKFQEPPAK